MSEESNNKNGYGDYEGYIVFVGEEQTFGSKGFRKRTLVVDANPDAKYPNPVAFTFKQDLVDVLNRYEQSVGRLVRIRYAINGRRWDGPRGVQYFLELAGLRIEDIGGKAEDVPQPAEAPDAAASAEQSDLPF